MRNIFVKNLLAVISILLTVNTSALAEDKEAKSTISINKIDVDIVKNNPNFSKDILLEELELALVASRKFEVLTRNTEKLEVIRDEQKLANSEFSSGSSAEQGKLETADYIVAPVITGFQFGRSSSPIPNIDSKYYTSDSGSLSVRFQILDSTTGAIKTAIPTESKFSTGQVISNSPKGSPGKERYKGLCSETAKKFVNSLINIIYPTKIIKINENGEIWLNRGEESGIAINETFKVYSQGEVLLDPDTGENLGTAETYKADIKIVRINPKASVAKLVNPKSTVALTIGDIVRRN